MCDRCETYMQDYSNFVYFSKNISLCRKCVRSWKKLYHKTYPEGTSVWNWNQLFSEFLKSGNKEPEKVTFT